MSYVIYNKVSTYYMPGMKSGGYKSKGAATAALNREVKYTEKRAAASELVHTDSMRELAFKPFRAELDLIAESLGLNPGEMINIMSKEPVLVASDYAIADAVEFSNNIEKMVTRVNLMSKLAYEERANTPISCSPAYETYWSM